MIVAGHRRVDRSRTACPPIAGRQEIVTVQADADCKHRANPIGRRQRRPVVGEARMPAVTPTVTPVVATDSAISSRTADMVVPPEECGAGEVLEEARWRRVRYRDVTGGRVDLEALRGSLDSVGTRPRARGPWDAHRTEPERSVSGTPPMASACCTPPTLDSITGKHK
ncbi:hypothetical protein ABZW30_24175 [Kitasatospora sp. NPDC004669]|uniref:hypothetical protein n=1 Tax=Kitasatospora sp. NPDC004669 TaxID=3154555 RepID=UPI0033AE9A26